MKSHLNKLATSITLGLIISSNALADADIAVQPSGAATEATARVDISVVVPEILIFGVGALGNDVAKLRWTVSSADGYSTGNNQSYTGPSVPSFSAPAPFSTTTAAAVVSNGGGGSASGNTATLPVYLFSNNGSDVTITIDDISGGSTGGGSTDKLDHSNGAATGTIPISDFTSTEVGNVTHPDISVGTGDSADTSHTNGIVNLSDNWSYSYTPTTIPVAGMYEARITYVAAQP